ncbi:phagosome assembly factor 1-like isoform X2 [Dysidea avara]|uniref:phagosome assembly factor 1-like isoform X2 n=1 Tax=Dysidea avara TaxID=196820 RepID=UPI0033286036
MFRMPLAQAIQILKMECANIRDVQVIYNEQRPLDEKFDLTINLSQDGVRLCFDPVVQRLKIIEVYDIEKVILKYCTKPFSSPDVRATIDQIYRSFGDTHPGEYDKDNTVYLLNFRGILFSFTLLEANLNSKRYNSGSNAQGYSLSCSQSGMLSNLAIYHGNDFQKAEAPHFPLDCFLDNCYSDRVDVEEQNGYFVSLQINLLVDDAHNSGPNQKRPCSSTVHICLNDSVQDVLSKLGAPSKVFFKSEDKMKIHSTNPDKPPHSCRSDYFFNYFTLGIDVLFDATSHTAKKFVLHTNIPGDYNFDIYHRCNFRISISQFMERENLTGSSQDQIDITAGTKWTEVGNSLTSPSDQPVILHRGPTDNSQNPFGSTSCYGYQNLIFEIMRNHHIASVTVYTPPTNRT